MVAHQVLQRIEQPDVWVREWLRTLLTHSAPQELVDEVGTILADYHPDAQRALLLHSGFEPAMTWRVLDRFGVTNFAAGPTVYRALRNSGIAHPACVPSSDPIESRIALNSCDGTRAKTSALGPLTTEPSSLTSIARAPLPS